MYCVYGENLISSGVISHTRMFKEDIDGNRAPIFPDDRAIIEPIDGLYKAYTTTGEVIAASKEIETVIARINYAQPNVEMVVNYKGAEMTVEEYEDKTAPTLYRLTFGEGEKTGFIGAMDVIKNGKASKVQLFASINDMRAYIFDKQKNDSYYYVFARRGRKLELDAGGIEEYFIPERHRDIERLSNALKKEREFRNNKVKGSKRNLKLKSGHFNVMTLYYGEKGRPNDEGQSKTQAQAAAANGG